MEYLLRNKTSQGVIAKEIVVVVKDKVIIAKVDLAQMVLDQDKAVQVKEGQVDQAKEAQVDLVMEAQADQVKKAQVDQVKEAQAKVVQVVIVAKVAHQMEQMALVALMEVKMDLTAQTTLEENKTQVKEVQVQIATAKVKVKTQEMSNQEMVHNMENSILLMEQSNLTME